MAVMAEMMHCRASSLLSIDDAYTAWCVDEAAATILAAIHQGRKIKPKKTTNNRELINQIMGGMNDGH